MYDPTSVQPMRDELVSVGIEELRTPEEVDALMKEEGIKMIVVNSVCGCAAGNARPGAMLALQNKVIPDRLTTVFAGQDREATEQARQYMQGIPPSSPCIALFRGSELIHVLPRSEIETRNAVQVAENLVEAFNEHCTAAGPSIPREELQKIAIFEGCGSSIPLFGEEKS